jgi:large subunit ribosomal protein L10
MSSKKNISSVEYIGQQFDKTKTIYFTDYSGLTVEQVNVLRTNLHEHGVNYHVLKNTLTLLVAKKNGYEGLESVLKGPTALAFAAGDPTAPARVFKEFLKKEGKIKGKPAVKGLVFEGKVLDASFYVKIADLPSREILLAQLLGGLQSPIQKTLSVLQAPMRELAGTLDALKLTKN